MGAATADISSSTGLVNGDTLYYRMHFKESATFVNSGGRQVVVDNIAINGTVNTVSVPEPTSLALLGLGGLTLVARRKR